VSNFRFGIAKVQQKDVYANFFKHFFFDSMKVHLHERVRGLELPA
jgi:hypothetical protein